MAGVFFTFCNFLLNVLLHSFQTFRQPGTLLSALPVGSGGPLCSTCALFPSAIGNHPWLENWNRRGIYRKNLSSLRDCCHVWLLSNAGKQLPQIFLSVSDMHSKRAGPVRVIAKWPEVEVHENHINENVSSEI